MSGKDKLISVEHLKWNVGGIKCGILTVDYLNWILDHEEPAVDAVPVIRCKDCIHYDGHYCHNKWWGDGYGSYTPPIKEENGYCDWAERKEDD